jgi:hypothetical protein
LGWTVDSLQLLCKPGTEALIADQCVSSRAANQKAALRKKKEEIEADRPHDPADDQAAPKTGVRERSAEAAEHPDTQHLAECPAHLSNPLLAPLNASWRVVDDPMQWRLQQKKSEPRTRNSGWRDRSFCTTREGLLRCVREYCGEVESAALAALRTLPDQHSMRNLDVRGTSYVQAEEQSEGLVFQGFGGLEG